MTPDSPATDAAPQLFLVTPPGGDAGELADALASALGGGPVAAVLIASGTSEEEREAIAARLVPIIQQAGAAALVADYTRVAGRTKADGVHVGSGLGDLRTTIQSFHPHRIVGAGALYSRHTAMEAGELEPDYVFFGRPHGDTHPEAHRKNLDLAEWWSDLMEIPAVVMAGSSLDSIEDARTTGAAFVGLHDAVWKHPGGPAEAVQIALQRLGQMERAA